MSDQAIRTFVLLQLKDITPGIGAFYDYSRYPSLNDQSAFLALFKDAETDRIMGWEMSRVALALVRVANDRYKVTHDYQLEGYLSLQDKETPNVPASEKVFQQYLDVIVQKLITMKVPNEQGLHLPSVPLIGQKLFGTVLCHYAQVKIPIAEILTPAEMAADDLLKINLTGTLKPGDQAVAGAEISVQ